MTIQLPLGVNRRYAFIAGIVLAAVWIWVAFDRPYRFPDHISWNIYSNRPLSGSSSMAEVVTDIFDFQSIESESIKSICSETQWNQSIVFKCDESVGGIGNVRNSILNCVRYAISAGAGLVLPSIVLRDSSDISQIRTGVKTDMSFMFDTLHFVDSLRLSCPSLKVFASMLNIKDFEHSHNPISLLPEGLIK